MHLARLSLSYFRNYEALDLGFVPGINCLTGDNGEGKTNILEAIHFLAMTKGFGSATDKFALKNGEAFFMVAGDFERMDKKVSVECNFQPGKGRRILVNRQQVMKMSAHIGFLPLIAILPEDTELITEGASLRRKFLDSFISQYDPEYLAALIRYERALEQRNALLQRMLEENRFSPPELEPWTLELIQAGQRIHKGRKEFLEEFAPLFSKYFRLIVSGKETPSLLYETQAGDNSEESWKQLFESHLRNDRYSGRSQAGTHKDDLQFRIGESPVKNFGSQGQRKTFVIALKLAQYELLMQRSGIPPLLLLDDIFDKLDVHRLKAITGILEKDCPGQVFVTDTSPERAREIFGHLRSKPVAFFRVMKGAVIREN